MQDAESGYADLIECFVTWAEARPDVRAALMIGSRARTDPPADEWADLDMIFVADDPERYRERVDWLAAIGHPWLWFLQSTPGGGFERRVLFQGGLDVDFVPESTERMRAVLDHGLPPFLAEAIRRGVRILVDKDGILAQMVDMPLPPQEATAPTAAEFNNLVHNFWYHSLSCAKHLRRGELCWGGSGVNSYLKGLLLRLLTMHTQAKDNARVDTWMNGRLLEDWADPRALAELPSVSGRYDAQDLWRALLATMHLFNWLAAETAQALGYAYPPDGKAPTVALVKRLYADRVPLYQHATRGSMTPR